MLTWASVIASVPPLPVGFGWSRSGTTLAPTLPTLSQVPLLPVGFSLVEEWKNAGWINPVYLPRKCMIDQGWKPPFLSARLLQAAASFVLDPCIQKCFENYGCWKCGGDYGMWVDGYPVRHRPPLARNSFPPPRHDLGAKIHPPSLSRALSPDWYPHAHPHHSGRRASTR